MRKKIISPYAAKETDGTFISAKMIYCKTDFAKKKIQRMMSKSPKYIIQCAQKKGNRK